MTSSYSYLFLFVCLSVYLSVCLSLSLSLSLSLRRPQRVKAEIHTDAVRSYINAASPNPVLGYKAPDVHPSELSLPRAHRTNLHQLRSGKCWSLRSYQFFINAAADDVCPDCLSAPHTTPQLFTCPAIPTTLTLLDLWFKPVEAAKFVSRISSFNHLPPLQPPLPPSIAA